MVVKYDILGRKVGSHHIAIGVLTLTFAGIYAAVGGGSKATTAQGPPINAGSKDEESFISDFLKEAEGKAPAKH